MNEAKTFAPESTVYDSQGREYIYQAESPAGHIVCPLTEYGGGYDEPPYSEVGAPVVLTEIHAAPPVHKRAEEMVKLEAAIAEKRKELQDIKQSVATVERESKSVMAALKQHEALVNVDRFLNGEITHYVELGTRPRILEAAEAKSPYEHRKLRLLSLSGKVNNATKQISWQLNAYADGSGGNIDVMPCLSLEEAVQVLKTQIEKAWSTWRVDKHWTNFKELAATSEKYGVPVPESYTERVKSEKLAEAQRELARYKSALAVAQKTVDDLLQDA